MAALITIPAGRCFRRSQSAKWVDPQPEKGMIEIRPDQGILTFVWRNQETQNAEDELLIFPGEANFERVSVDKSGRTFVLKFNSSNQTHFFWLQRSSLGQVDARATVDLDAVLQDPDYRLGSHPVPVDFFPSRVPTADLLATPAAPDAKAPAAPGAPLKATGTSAAAAAATPAAGASASAAASASSAAAGSSGDNNQDIARLLYNWADQHLPIPEDEDASLTDILTPETVGRLLAERPDLAKTLAPFFPPDLGEASTPESLLRVVATPQFRDAVGSLEMALRNGTLPESMIPWVHLPQDTAWNLRNFLTALREVQEDKPTDDDKMDTD